MGRGGATHRRNGVPSQDRRTALGDRLLAPDAGDTVKVQIDPQTMAVRFDVKNDPRLSLTGRDRLAAEAFQRALDGGQPSPS